MHSNLRLVQAAYCLTAALLSAGCGSGVNGGDGRPLAAGPHGGVAVPLGEKGFAEIVCEPSGGSGSRAPTSMLVVYLLQSDLKTPLSTIASVALAVTTPEDPSPKSYTLQAKRESTARFASEPGKFDYDELTGEISATVDGESFTRTFAYRP